MSKKLFICLLLIVLLPLSVLGWLGHKLSVQDRTQVQMNIQRILQGRLEDTRSQLHSILQKLEKQLLRDLRQQTFTVDALRQYTQQQPMVRQTFWLDANNTLLFPRKTQALNAQERAFLERTRRIWSGQVILIERGNDQSEVGSPFPTPRSAPSIQTKRNNQQRLPKQRAQKRFPSTRPSQRAYRSYQPPPLQQSSRQARQQRRLGRKRTLSSGKIAQMLRGWSLSSMRTAQNPPPASHAWLAWYWAEGLHLLFWRQTRNGQIVGVEIDRIILMAHLIQELPTTTHLKGRIKLRDERGEIIHQWGGYDEPKGQKALASLRLQAPLYSWSLAYYGPENDNLAAFEGQLYLNLGLMIGFVALGLLALAFYLYWEYSRDMREASQKVTFVTQVSHELKTPLTNIRLYAELLENRIDEEDPKAHRYTHVIVTESQRLSRLITNILTFSKRQKESLSLHPRALDIDELIERILEQFAPTLTSKGFTIERQLSSAQHVYADPDAIEQIIGNLLSNVEKYAASGQWVKVMSGTIDDHTVYVDVSDKGPGIPTGHKHKIFQPFFRGSDRLSDGVTGTGIGLSIARELAQMQQGTLHVLDRTKGTTFRLTLPTPQRAKG
ncbi:MAG TPA: hypothetical protein DCE42_00055, partial [Myxococcales bacterium]|nr:hypothetical protein [Myxococcales bacterium]